MSVMDTLVSRRTYRRFAQKAVPQDVVDDIVEAVRLSSCGANRQAVRLVVVAELLEQHRLALHDRQTGFRADIAQAQHGGAVGNNSHHVALEGVLIHVVGVFLDLAAGFGHTGSVGGGQVIAGGDLHLAYDAHLALVGLVHFQSSFIVIHLNFLQYLTVLALSIAQR